MSSKRALVIVELKSCPSAKPSISKNACVPEDNVLFALSHAVLNLRKALAFFEISNLCFLFISSTKNSTNLLSKSSPPKCVFPAVAITSKIPSSIVSKDTSKVPPPKSKINTFFSSFI